MKSKIHEHKKNNMKIVSKNLIKIIVILFVSINCNAQTEVNINTYNQGDNAGKYFKDINNNFPKFTGTWENTTGNITFRIILWKITQDPLGSPIDFYMDRFGGSFMIIQNAGTPNEVVLCNSVKTYPNGYTSDRSFWCDTSDGVFLGGHMEDNCATGGTETWTAFFSLVITNPGVTPAIAQWSVKPRGFLVGSYYSIPTNVMMTKVN